MHLFSDSCAGLCQYEGRGGLCSIRLSRPLLKFRSRKDLVETLLVFDFSIIKIIWHLVTFQCIYMYVHQINDMHTF